MTPTIATAAIADFQETFAAVRAEMARVVIGHEQAIETILTAFFAGGHVLIEGVPGIGKTLIVRSLAEALNLSFNRIQFTVDLMPADITGTRIINERPTAGREFVFVPGPIFAHLLLGDEINRATPKTQSALLEAMAEQQVTVAGTSYRLAAAVLRARHAEPDRDGRHVSAARGAARSLPLQGAARVPGRGASWRASSRTTTIADPPTIRPVLGSRSRRRAHRGPEAARARGAGGAAHRAVRRRARTADDAGGGARRRRGRERRAALRHLRGEPARRPGPRARRQGDGAPRRASASSPTTTSTRSPSPRSAIVWS